MSDNANVTEHTFFNSSHDKIESMMSRPSYEGLGLSSLGKGLLLRAFFFILKSPRAT